MNLYKAPKVRYGILFYPVQFGYTDELNMNKRQIIAVSWLCLHVFCGETIEMWRKISIYVHCDLRNGLSR